MGMDINEARAKIEVIDKEMAKLFEERMACAQAIAIYKKNNNMQIFDAAREQQLLEKNSEYIKNENLKDYYKEFLTDVMGVSKKYQREIIGE